MAETPEPPGHAGPIQFDKAEYGGGAPGNPVCTRCSAPIGGTYYEANGSVICSRCQALLQWERTHGSGAGRFGRAAFFGLLAAALGSALYYGVAALTNMEFGLIAIVVGLMVGSAVRWGSKGRGGWLYQGLAMFLTYASIVSTYLPHIVKAMREQFQKEQPVQTAGATAGKTPGSPAPASQAKPVSPTEVKSTGAGSRLVGLLVALAILIAFAFAAPFLAGIENIMGIVIIAIGLYEAWKINRRAPLVITGPYRVGAPVPTPPSG